MYLNYVHYRLEISIKTDQGSLFVDGWKALEQQLGWRPVVKDIKKEKRPG